VAILVKYLGREITWAAVETAASGEPRTADGGEEQSSDHMSQPRSGDVDARREQAVAAALKAIATYRITSNAEPRKLANALRLSAVALETA
jgi:hypothetical protein